MTLADNLAKLQQQRLAAQKRNRSVIDSIVEIASRQQESAANAGTGGPRSTYTPSADPSAPVSAGSGSGTPATQTDRAGHTGGFQPGFNSSLQRMLHDFGGKVSVSSGYRSPERQAQLWAAALKKYGSAAVARKWVAPPGRSNHGRGTAADLHFADAATRQMVHNNAAKYGLIFPLSNENWHIEPIGNRR